MKMIIAAVFILFSGWLSAGEDAGLSYIEAYKHIAISEMERTGIPASIKMAQGLLESGCGKSTLAVQANNHFGIKCGGKWTGDTFYREDDDYKDGKLIKSCFRKFSSASQSYFAHSDFLVNQNRYAFLFEYGATDFHAWAHGLKKAGYATDNAYPSKLIKLIEKYELYRLDQEEVKVYASTDNTSEEKKRKPQKILIIENDAPSSVIVADASEGNKRNTSSRRTKSSSKRTSKKRRAASRENTSEKVFHIVQENESLSEIAMIHDLDETLVRLRNRIPKDAEPLAGEKIYLRKKISFFKRPEFTRTPTKGAVVSQDEYIF